MSDDAKQVTFELPSGARVTCPPETARKLGWTEPRKAAPKAAQK